MEHAIIGEKPDNCLYCFDLKRKPDCVAYGKMCHIYTTTILKAHDCEANCEVLCCCGEIVSEGQFLLCLILINIPLLLSLSHPKPER